MKVAQLIRKGLGFLI